MLDQLVKKSKHPLALKKLERLQETLFGQRKERYYRFLYYLALEYQPKLALEIGVYRGMGSIHLAEAAKQFNGHVAGVDVFDQRLPTFENNYTFLHMNSWDMRSALEELVEKYGKLGLVFQDSSHHYLESMAEWNTCQEFLADNFVWVCDDITPAFRDPKVDPEGKGMIQYFYELPGRKRTFDNLHRGSVIGVIQPI